MSLLIISELKKRKVSVFNQNHMNINLQTKTLKDSSSLEVEDSYLIVNGTTIGSVSPLVEHKERYVEKTKKTINRAALNGKLTQTNNAIPPTKEEINRLAKAWCELLVGQMQENTINRN